MISSGGSELVLGVAIGDSIAGSQTVSVGTSSGGTITSETILAGGSVLLAVKGTSASDTTVDSGGTLGINGNISSFDTVLSGGTVDLESAKATLTGSLVFSGGGTLEVTGNTSAGFGDLAVITGFTGGGRIDVTSDTTVGAVGTAAALSVITSAGNTYATIAGGGASQTFIFSGTAISGDLTLIGDGASGVDLIDDAASGGVTSVGSGPPQSDLIITSGETLTVYSGGTIIDATILSGGSAVIQSGGVDSATTVVSGGSETILGTASSDTVQGSQTASGSAAAIASETVQSGGSITLAVSGATATGITVGTGGLLTLDAGTVATETTISGGMVTLSAADATLSGTLDFGLGGTLEITTPSNAGSGDQAVISGFYTSDTIALPSFGSGTTLSTTTSGGNTVATVSSGGVSETLLFSGSIGSNLTVTSNTGSAGGEEIAYVPSTVPTTTQYTPGDLVLSIYGDGANTGTYTLDQAAPIVLEEITPTGMVVSQLVLPQTTYTLNGVTEYAISGEYQSASEGLLTLAENGQSLTIIGYGVTATAFDAADGATIYGTTALGQTSSLTSGTSTPVPRVIADIGCNATIDTSTALYNIFNTNNPRSIVTVNGTTFYVSGQGNGADGTEGVFLADDGDGSATPIYNTLTDTRDVEIANGQLYVSIDSKLNNGGGLYDFGSTLPTTATAPTDLPGIGATVLLTSGTANTVNAADIGQSVNLSPEQYFFADPTTLYIADGGDPKEGGLGDGGLQKWSLVDGTWVLDYTLSEGLNMVPDTESDGTTGLIGLTGTVEGGNVILYATNETVAETDQTYLYGITDTLSATTLPTDESFTLLETAAPDTLIRGVAFAPTSSSTIPEVSGTLTVSNTVTSSGLTVASGGEIIVLSGGTISAITLLSGASAVISSGGVDDGTFIANGGTELVLGAATGDYIDGTQTVSNGSAVVTSETVGNGGQLDLVLAGAIANESVVLNGGTLAINGHAFANDTTLSGGLLELESPKATISNTLTFAGSGGTIEATAVVSAGYGDLAVISGFGPGDVIDERVLGAGTTLSTTVAGGNSSATFISGSTKETFVLAGTSYGSGLSLTSDGSGGEELIYTAPPPIVVSSGVTSTGVSATSVVSIVVLSSGTLSDAVISSGGSATISSGGVDSGTTILAGGFETVSGSASGDQVYGVQEVSGANQPASVSNETVYNGGSIELFLKPDTGTDITVSSGGSLLLNGNVSATNTVIEAGGLIELQSPKAVFNGTLTFSGAATLEFTANTSAGFGSLGVISGFGAGDVIDETTISQTATLSAPTISGGNTQVTISGGTFPQTFTFAGTTIGSHLVLQDDSATGVELVYVPCFRAGTRLATETGEVAVESLRPGDRLRTARGGVRPVRWIGHRRVDCARHPDPRAVWPVRVAAGAFGPGRPHRDLYLSPDHAVFVDGMLIAIRQLVNGASIAPVSVGRVSYFHVELDRHDVLLAEGLPAESYLDTGNRADFENAGLPTTLHPAFARHADAARTDGACAPLVVDAERVEPVWRRLAAAAGCTPGLAAVTCEPDLVLSAGGRTLKPLSHVAGCYVFAVPRGYHSVAIRSRAACPTDLRPWLDDRRRLGVPVGRIVLRGRNESTAMPVDHPALTDGWHAPERNGHRLWRWTDGAAVLPIPDGTMLVEIALAGAMTYPVAMPADTAAPAALLA